MRCADCGQLAFRLPALSERESPVRGRASGWHTAASLQTMTNHPSSRAAGSSVNTGVLAARDLLGGCLQRLTELGVPLPSWEEAVALYRKNLAYGFFLWAMTQYTPEAFTTKTVRRLGHAVEDHKTFELLGV